MRIGLVTTHAWPIPNKARTGDIFLLDLAIALEELGHTVTTFSPAGTSFPRLMETPCAFGQAKPSAMECERWILDHHLAELLTQDIVHDISTGKMVARALAFRGRKTCVTMLGGPWRDDHPPVNLIVQSKAQRDRILRGATDYEGTKTPEMGGPPGRPVKDAHVVYDGIDTGFYCPTDYTKGNYVLWLNRWHPMKGAELAIRFAKETGIAAVVAGVHPDDETSDGQADFARRMANACSGVANIRFVWLPGADPDHDLVKRRLYREALALLYTTQFQEPFGLSQVEALACGTPVIAPRYGSIPEILEHGKTGWIFADDADVINSMKTGVAWANSVALPANCVEAAVTRFDRIVMAANYLTEYENILAGATW